MPKPVQASSYTFRSIIEGGYLYVDKTEYLYQLVHRPIGIYFLSRPRRFGKSLTLSTLAEIFQGNKELFRGLWLYDSDYQWQKHPVIRIDFSKEQIQSAEELQEVITSFLEDIAQSYQLQLPDAPYQRQFRRLIQQLAAQGKVVILIDEYDKPIIDNLNDLAKAKEIRETLRGFYTIIKAMDQYIRFVFITGISKFSKVGVFSSLNNLDDLTMDTRFATALGITESELRQNFQEHIALFAQQAKITPETLLQQIREWYNGFCFVEDAERVYNPFSTLQLFNKQRFANYWFETGTPTFLIKLLKEQNYDIRQLDDLEVSELGFSTYELENLAIIPLLFQTGYLTIQSYDKLRRLYKLYYPNYEVENAFLVYLLHEFSATPHGLSESYLWKMIDALQVEDFPQFFAVLNVLFANIPYGIQVDQEKYYQSIFVLIFKLIGLRIEAEVQTNTGRIDAVVELDKQIFLFEFKLDKSAEEALKQIKEHTYAQKYRLKRKPITRVGANFVSDQRQVADWKTEPDQAV